MARASTVLPVAICCLMAPFPASAQADGSPFSANVTLTTDYLYRGLSQTDSDPAIQGGFDYTHSSGFFAGLWASNVDFATNPPRNEPRDIEIDYFIGYNRELGAEWSAQATLIRYTYPGADADFHYDYNELLLDATFRGLVTAGLGYTNDIFGSDATAVTYELTGRYPLAEHFDLHAGAGYFDLDDLIDEAYLYWNLGVSAFVGQFTLDLGYFDTDSTAERFFGEAAGDRVVLSLSAAIR